MPKRAYTHCTCMHEVYIAMTPLLWTEHISHVALGFCPKFPTLLMRVITFLRAQKKRRQG